MVAKTLREMRLGGMWDHVGHGFHRYSTDAEWLVPHFEKMLYDQALLAMAYVEGWQATGEEDFARTAREILEYVSRDMTSPEGGFYSAEDADSEGEEGLFYLWTISELKGVLGEEDGALAVELFRATEEGNYRDEATGQKTGRNILHLDVPLGEHASRRGEAIEDLAARVGSIRSRLYEAREGRVHPLKDDKVLTDWNGLMIAAYALAGRALGEPEYSAVARRAADHLLTRLRKEDGSLYKLSRLGVAAGDGLFEDYAYATWGLLELFETTQEVRWLGAAIDLSERMVTMFHDAERGGFYLAPADSPDLIVRPKEGYDGAQPSGNSVAASNLLRLARMTGETRWEELASGVFEAFSGHVLRSPGAHSHMLMAYGFAVGPTREVVIAGAVEEVAASAGWPLAPGRWLRGCAQPAPAAPCALMSALVPMVHGRRARRFLPRAIPQAPSPAAAVPAPGPGPGPGPVRAGAPLPAAALPPAATAGSTLRDGRCP